jgi:transcriptional regulator with XRE-family HTH domain
MARPKGHKLSRPAWDDILRISATSLTEVSKRSEVPRPTLSALYGGHNGASMPTIRKIAAALDVQPATLFPSLRLEDDVEAAA